MSLLAAVTELGSALRELVDASVRTTVGADELSAAADEARRITSRLTAAQRPPTQLPVLDDPIAFRRVSSPVTVVGSAGAPPLHIRHAEDCVVAGTSLGLTSEAPPWLLR